MKIFFKIFLAAAVVTLLSYDYRVLAEATKIAAKVDSISVALDAGGRHRYAVYKHLADLAMAENSTLKTQIKKRFLAGDIFSEVYGVDPDVPVLADWPDSGRITDLQMSLKEAKLSYPGLEEGDQAADMDAIKAWSESMVSVLDQLASSNVSLSQYLSGRLSAAMKQTIFVNVASLMALFVITLIFYYQSQRKIVREIAGDNTLLEDRQKKVADSKRVLISLTEDLLHEKNSALAFSEQLEGANQALSRKNKEMEQFIYSVSHDLRSPLVTIGGFAKILSRELADKLTERQTHQLARIQENVNQMELLLSDLLELSRVVQQAIEKETVDVASIVAQQCRALEGAITDSKARINIRDPLHSIDANERLLSQCVSNLINNAINYRDPDRPLIVDISTTQDALHTTLAIKDNGIGIDPQYHELVFRIFERLSVGDGSGVGLTIVKTIMEKHHGTVSLESEPGVGSCFYLAFPRAS